MGVYTALCVKITYTTKTWNKLPKKNNEKLGNYKVWFSCLNFLFLFLIIPVPPICSVAKKKKIAKGKKELFGESREMLVLAFQESDCGFNTCATPNCSKNILFLIIEIIEISNINPAKLDNIKSQICIR